MSIKKSFKWKVGYIPSNSKLKERKKYIGTIPATKIKKPRSNIFFLTLSFAANFPKKLQR